MKKYLFPIDALVVWCPTWSKNLGRTLVSNLTFWSLGGLRFLHDTHLSFGTPWPWRWQQPVNFYLLTGLSAFGSSKYNSVNRRPKKKDSVVRALAFLRGAFVTTMAGISYLICPKLFGIFLPEMSFTTSNTETSIITSNVCQKIVVFSLLFLLSKVENI